MKMSKVYKSIIRDFGSPPTGANLRERGGIIFVYYFAPYKRAKAWADNIKAAGEKFTFIDTSKI